MLHRMRRQVREKCDILHTVRRDAKCAIFHTMRKEVNEKCDITHCEKLEWCRTLSASLRRMRKEAKCAMLRGLSRDIAHTEKSGEDPQDALSCRSFYSKRATNYGALLLRNEQRYRALRFTSHTLLLFSILRSIAHLASFLILRNNALRLRHHSNFSQWMRKEAKCAMLRGMSRDIAHTEKSTGWRRPIGCLKLQVILQQKSHELRGSFAENDPWRQGILRVFAILECEMLHTIKRESADEEESSVRHVAPWVRVCAKFELYVSFAEYSLFYRALLQKSCVR